MYSLELSGTNLVWMEYSGVTTTRLPLRISTAVHPAAEYLLVYEAPGDSGDIQWDVPPYILSGNLLVWQGSTAGKVWQRDIDTGKIKQISPDGVLCQLGDFDGTNAVMGCTSDRTQTAWDSYFIRDWIVFWSPAVGYRLLTGAPSDSQGYWAGFWNGSLWADFYDQYMTDTTWTIPIATLTAK